MKYGLWITRSVENLQARVCQAQLQSAGSNEELPEICFRFNATEKPVMEILNCCVMQVSS